MMCRRRLRAMVHQGSRSRRQGRRGTPRSPETGHLTALCDGSFTELPQAEGSESAAEVSLPKVSCVFFFFSSSHSLVRARRSGPRREQHARKLEQWPSVMCDCLPLGWGRVRAESCS